MAEMGYEGALQAMAAIPGELAEMVMDAAEPAMGQAILYLHGELPEYPPKPGTGSPSPLVTAKQRRWFFAAVKAGQVPGWEWVEEMDANGRIHGHPVGSYRRTNTLGRQFTTEVQRNQKGIQGMLGTSVPYAAWVVGPSYPGETINGDVMFQARIHEGRWWQFDAVIADSIDDAWNVFDDELFDALLDAWRNR